MGTERFRVKKWLDDGILELAGQGINPGQLFIGGQCSTVINSTAAHAADPVGISIGYLSRAGVKPTLSLVEQPAEDDGVAGVHLAIEDNNTTGKFLNQRFTLKNIRLQDGDDAARAAVGLGRHSRAVGHPADRASVAARMRNVEPF